MFVTMRRGRRLSLLVISVMSAAMVLISPVKHDATARDWRTASRESAGIAPNPETHRAALVQVYGARAWGWRGYFGVHTWIAVKPTDDKAYTIYEVIGWRLRWQDSAVVIRQRPPDTRWFGNTPELLADLRGEGVDDVIRRIHDVALRYPYAQEYSVWPGPNSNTFTAFVAREVPELKVDLPPTAIGKDYLGQRLMAATPSGTGVQFSLMGLFGIMAGTEEGVELNLIGLTFGIDPLGPAVKLPFLGRIGPERVFPVSVASSVVRNLAKRPK